jgi:elongation factor Ts
MANISAAMVKDLREKTGAGMMDCKAALNETGGDIEAAVDWLRKKGLAKAAKKAGRVAAEGLVAAESSGRTAAVVEVNSETDFVARNEQFQAFVREAAKIALMGEGTVESLEASHFPGHADHRQGAPPGAHRHHRREHDAAPRAKLTVGQGVISTYVHNQVIEGLGQDRRARRHRVEGRRRPALDARPPDRHARRGHEPGGLDASGVDAAVVERESAILREKNAGKPDHVMQKIVESGLKSYYKEVTLWSSPSSTMARSRSAGLKEGRPRSAPGELTDSCVRAGEGIEKEETDFRAEVRLSGHRAKPTGRSGAGRAPPFHRSRHGCASQLPEDDHPRVS